MSSELLEWRTISRRFVDHHRIWATRASDRFIRVGNYSGGLVKRNQSLVLSVVDELNREGRLLSERSVWHSRYWALKVNCWPVKVGNYLNKLVSIIRAWLWEWAIDFPGGQLSWSSFEHNRNRVSDVISQSIRTGNRFSGPVERTRSWVFKMSGRFLLSRRPFWAVCCLRSKVCIWLRK